MPADYIYEPQLDMRKASSGTSYTNGINQNHL